MKNRAGPKPAPSLPRFPLLRVRSNCFRLRSHRRWRAGSRIRGNSVRYAGGCCVRRHRCRFRRHRGCIGGHCCIGRHSCCCTSRSCIRGDSRVRSRSYPDIRSNAHRAHAHVRRMPREDRLTPQHCSPALRYADTAQQAQQHPANEYSLHIIILRNFCVLTAQVILRRLKQESGKSR